MANQVRIKDICDRLGLSKATVSKALNGYESVNADTRQKVLACARQLGYAPVDRIDRLSAATKRVGFCTHPATSGEVISPEYYLQASLLSELSRLNYETVVFPPDILSRQQIPYDQVLKTMRLDGAFITGLRLDDAFFHQLQETAFPTVTWDLQLDNPNVCSVLCDSIAGLRMAAEHLIRLGHRRIGFINGHRKAQVALRRLDGYILALTDAGIPYDPSLVYFGDFTETSGVLGAKELIEKQVTGIVCASDMAAVGVCRTAQAIGLSVPDDLSVVGYDDTNLTSMFAGGITSVNQHTDRIGQLAADLLHNMLSGTPMGDIVLQPTLTVRGSTAAPKRVE